MAIQFPVPQTCRSTLVWFHNDHLSWIADFYPITIADFSPFLANSWFDRNCVMAPYLMIARCTTEHVLHDIEAKSDATAQAVDREV